MADRHDVHPHHLLRAVLADRLVREVLAETGADADALLLTLDRLWLEASDTIEVEEIEARGIDVATVLTAINPPFDREADWGGRRLTDATRDVLVRSLGVRAVNHGATMTSGHLLLGLLGSKDRLVAGTFRAHGVQLRAVRPVVERRSRRA